MGKSIYEKCVELGVEVCSHASDLHVPVNEVTRELMKSFDGPYSTFTSNIDGALWYDVFFAYDPFWKAAKG